MTTFLGTSEKITDAAGRMGRLPRLRPHGTSGISNPVEDETQLRRVSLWDCDWQSLESVTDLATFVGLL
ncbi:MAG: hypothetical protein AM325_010830 [Candidatus Thorarchaeota archaeon SMTZ1-45]